MSTKRRLSHGSVHHDLEIDENDEIGIDDMAVANDKFGGSRGSILSGKRGGTSRRKSSIGLNGVTASEQIRIAEMYKTVIKMSSENVSYYYYYYIYKSNFYLLYYRKLMKKIHGILI
jgi:hypothetical protein